MRFWLEVLFETFSIKFVRLCSVGLTCENYLLVAVEHPTWCPIAHTTKYGRSDEILKSMKEEIIFYFWPPKWLYRTMKVVLQLIRFKASWMKIIPCGKRLWNTPPFEIGELTELSVLSRIRKRNQYSMSNNSRPRPWSIPSMDAKEKLRMVALAHFG